MRFMKPSNRGTVKAVSPIIGAGGDEKDWVE
jgi:hypothetical protein